MSSSSIPPNGDQPTNVIKSKSLRSYFYQSLQTVCEKRKTDASEHSIAYLVNLMCQYGRSEQLFDYSKNKSVTLQPLALLYDDAIQASNANQRHFALRRLGDIALFVAGLFAPSLTRKPVGVDYYINMGGGAYGWLSQDIKSGMKTTLNASVFHELSARFTDLVNILDEFAENSSLRGNKDLITLYEQWLSSSDPRIASKIQRAGVSVSSVKNQWAH